MPHIHERGQSARMKRPQYLAVVFYFGLVELPFFRLDARPLYGEAVAGVAEGPCDIKILLVAMVVIARASRGGRASSRKRGDSTKPR